MNLQRSKANGWRSELPECFSILVCFVLFVAGFSVRLKAELGKKLQMDSFENVTKAKTNRCIATEMQCFVTNSRGCKICILTDLHKSECPVYLKKKKSTKNLVT